MVGEAVDRVEGRLDVWGRGDEGLPKPRVGLHRVRAREDERLPALGVDVPREDLGAPVGPPDIADEELGVLERDWDRGARRSLDALAHHELERLVAPEIHLLAVSVGPRVRELPRKPEEHPERALVSLRLHVRGDARKVHRAVHPLPGAEEDALPQSVVRGGRRGEVDRQVRDGRVRGGDRARDDPEDADVGREIAIGLLEELESEVELALGHPLSEVEV